MKNDYDLDKVEMLNNRVTGERDLVYGNKVIAKNVYPPIMKRQNSGIVYGRYQIPFATLDENELYPVHFFVYSVNTDKTYSYRKDRLFISEVYDYPLCQEDNHIKRFAIKDGIAMWETIYDIDNSQNVVKGGSDLWQIETKLSEADFQMPLCITEDCEVQESTGNELSKVLWKQIYYHLGDKIFNTRKIDRADFLEINTLENVKAVIEAIIDAKLRIDIELSSSDEDEDEDSDIAKAKDEYRRRDIEELIKALDRRIAELENGEEGETEEKSLEAVSRINKNYKLYRFCRNEKLDGFKDLLHICEEQLGIKDEDDITYLLLRIIRALRVIYSTEENHFTYERFNKLFEKTISEKTKNRKMARRAMKEIFINPVSKDYPLDVECLQAFYPKLEKAADYCSKRIITNSGLDVQESKGNRIGWIEYCESENEIGVFYEESIPYGDLRFSEEIHPSVGKEQSVKINDPDFRYAEIYYSLSDRMLHVINNEKIPLQSLMKGMCIFEESDVSYIIDDDYIDHTYSKPLLDDRDRFRCTLDNYERYLPQYLGIRYGGLVILDDDSISVMRLQIKDLKAYILANDHMKLAREMESGEVFWVRKTPHGDICTIVSDRFDRKVISAIDELFGLNGKWKWRRYLSGE